MGLRRWRVTYYRNVYILKITIAHFLRLFVFLSEMCFSCSACLSFTFHVDNLSYRPVLLAISVARSHVLGPSCSSVNHIRSIIIMINCKLCNLLFNRKTCTYVYDDIELMRSYFLVVGDSSWCSLFYKNVNEWIYMKPLLNRRVPVHLWIFGIFVLIFIICCGIGNNV